jgi:hypothetical protein
MLSPMRLSLTPVLPWLLLVLGGCELFQSGTPAQAYKDFHGLVRKSEYSKAYGLLSRASQEALTARAQAITHATDGGVKPEPPSFFANVPLPLDVTEITLLREEGDVAVLRVLSSGRSSEVRMVREASGWKVDLSQSLQP